MGNVNSIPIEIWFDICEFVKLYEAPNLFLVNCNSLTICEEFFFSGNVEKKRRNVRDISMIQSEEGTLEIKILRDGKFVPVPVPEVDPPNIFKSFGNITIRKSCQKQALQFLLKFQTLISDENAWIVCNQQFFSNMDTTMERELFLNLMEQNELTLELNGSYKFPKIARMLVEPLLAKFNGFLSMPFENEYNLCEPEGQQEDAKLIYEWLSASTGKIRRLNVYHYDGKKALELACKIVKHFEMMHSDKKIAEKMYMMIEVLFGTQTDEITKYEKKICNSDGDHLATLRSILKSEYEKPMKMKIAYLFFTKPLDDIFPIDEEFKMFIPKFIDFE